MALSTCHISWIYVKYQRHNLSLKIAMLIILYWGKNKVIFFFLPLIYPHSMQYLHAPGLTTQMPVGQMPVGGAANYRPEHQTYTRASLPEYVISTISGPQPETTQDRTQNKRHTQSQDKIEISDSAGDRTRKPGTLPTTPRRQTKKILRDTF